MDEFFEVHEALDNAVDNGHGEELKSMSIEEIAEDLRSQTGEFEDVPDEELHSIIRSWQAKQ
jgi:hypothetical protein